MTALMDVLTEEAALEMPPHLTWFTGRELVVRFLAAKALHTRGAVRMVPTSANGQPAFGTYRRGPDGGHHPQSLQVLTVTATGVTHVVAFHDPSLFPAFGLPASL